jgi:hypothetical protein
MVFGYLSADGQANTSSFILEFPMQPLKDRKNFACKLVIEANAVVCKV